MTKQKNKKNKEEKELIGIKAVKGIERRREKTTQRRVLKEIEGTFLEEDQDGIDEVYEKFNRVERKRVPRTG